MPHPWKIEEGVLYPLGRWEKRYVESLFSSLEIPDFSRVELSRLESLDTYGALILAQLCLERKVEREGIRGPDRLVNLLLKVMDALQECPEPRRKGTLKRILEVTGGWFFSFVTFVGFVGTLFLEGVLKPSQFEWRAFFRDIQEMGLKALPIIGVLCFLIGVVIAYQSAVQLARFGANIFIVDLVVLSVVRELAPLIVAVLMSGRSASSYTATIGVMRVNDEIDALEVMGISPFASVVLPRVVSLVLITPFLVVFADLVGIAGGMLVSKLTLDIEFVQFIKRMEGVLKPHHFWAGMVKAPVFGLFVALVGTWKGFMVEKKAESVGERVIESVVISIFGVLVIDAVFSIILRILGV